MSHDGYYGNEPPWPNVNNKAKAMELELGILVPGTDTGDDLGVESPEATKEKRIAARRKRVMAKIEAAQLAAQGKEPSSNDDDAASHPEKNRISSKQIKQSETRLDKLSTDGTTLVTNVKVAGESKEVTLRLEEDDEKRARRQRLEAEVTAGAERFEEIVRKWSQAGREQIPQDLQSLLQEQKASCSAMVDEKDKLLGELQQELKAKDDQYVKHLKKQAEDVDLILERMEEQSKTLFKAYCEELVEIERSFDNERRKLIESQKSEWDKATQERSEKEKFYLEDREIRIEKNEEEIQHLRVKNAEEFNQIKIRLETKIQSLQQEIQQMKATFQLNAEKLEYNFQVLKKRDEENTVTISIQKRRITRQQDTLNILRGKLSKQEKACKAEMQLLMDEYRKNTEQYRELMKKVKHFQAVDSKRFHDVWVMNEQRVRRLAQEVGDVDRLVHQQQLGLEWEDPPPVESPMTKALAKKPDNKNISEATLYASQILSEVGSSTSSADNLSKLESIAETCYSPVLIKQMLELLCSECEFLIESKLLRLLAPLDQDEQLMMKLDSIFKAIGIETEDDVHLLMKFFVSKSTEEGAPSLIHPNEVISHLTVFVQEQGGDSRSSTSFLTKGLVGNSYEGLLDGEFWKQIARTLPEKREQIWTALQEGLDKYHTVLKTRETRIAETDGVRQQNTELRLLLHQYMHARVNQELEIPPTLILPVPMPSAV